MLNIYSFVDHCAKRNDRAPHLETLFSIKKKNYEPLLVFLLRISKWSPENSSIKWLRLI